MAANELLMILSRHGRPFWSLIGIFLSIKFYLVLILIASLLYGVGSVQDTGMFADFYHFASSNLKPLINKFKSCGNPLNGPIAYLECLGKKF